jgi:methylase of polypeptide subunit release factors
VSAPPRLDPASAPDLAADFAGFTVGAVESLLGPVATGALHRDQPVAAHRVLARTKEPLGTLVRLLVLGGDVTVAELDAALPRTRAAGAVQVGLVEVAGTGPDDAVRPVVDLRPYAADDATWWLASDLSELATGGPLRPDHVLGVGGASATLAQWTPRRPVGRALDLGTGCGVQAFHAARHAASVVATDVSRRALAFATFNATLNAAADGAFSGRALDLRQGSLLEPVHDDLGGFDLVVSNPPFVITPRSPGVPQYEYRDGGLAGDGVVERLVRDVGTLLADGGVAQLLGNWEHRAGADWRERVGAWLPDDVQAWVVQREVQDPAAYAETWARDGGHRPGTAEHDALVAAWLDDFEAREVEAVGFGVLTLRRAPGAAWRRLEEVRGPVGGPLGAVVTAVLDAETWVRATSDDDLLAARLVVAADVTEERHALPGAADPSVVLLRQGGGLQRVVRADGALAGLVGACDGGLSVAQIVGALGVLLDEPEAELRARLLPQVRHLVADTLLVRGDSPS